MSKCSSRFRKNFIQNCRLTEKGSSILGLQKLVSSDEYSALMLSKNADHSIYIYNNIINKDLLPNGDFNLSRDILDISFN